MITYPPKDTLKIIYLFLAVLGLSCCVGFSLVSARGGYCLVAGFSLRWLLSLQSTVSRLHGLSSCGYQALEYRLNSCSAQTQVLRSMWDLPRSGIEPMSPALAGGFFTFEPPGKPPKAYLLGQGKLTLYLWSRNYNMTGTKELITLVGLCNDFLYRPVSPTPISSNTI